MNNQYNVLAPYYDFLQKDIDYNDWIEKINSLNAEKDIEILEIGCGTGTLSNLLYKQGYKNIDAFDLSQDMIDIAVTKNKNINFFVDNAINFSLGKKYDLIIMLMDTMNYIIEEKDIKKTFQTINEHANQNAIIYIDIHNKRNLKNFHKYFETKILKENIFYDWYSEIDNDKEKIVKHIFEFYENEKLIQSENHYQRIKSYKYYVKLNKNAKLIKKIKEEYRTHLFFKRR